MKTRFVRFLCAILVLVLFEQAVYADIPDPGTAIVAGASLVGVVILGFFVATIVLVSFLVILAIKRRQASADDA